MDIISVNRNSPCDISDFVQIDGNISLTLSDTVVENLSPPKIPSKVKIDKI